MKQIATLALLSLLLLPAASMGQRSQGQLYKKLRKQVQAVTTEFDQISEERQSLLVELGDGILEELQEDFSAHIMFICTHNSRRSQMGMAWLQAAAAYYGIDGIGTFSGGLEVTAFNPRAVAALERAGFKLAQGQEVTDNNPQYIMRSGSSLPIAYSFSKRYDDPVNPHEDFLAVMVCSDADRSCPVVPGADKRIALPYDDPRYYDDTPSEEQMYDERSREIAREMFFLTDYVKQQLILKAEQSRR